MSAVPTPRTSTRRPLYGWLIAEALSLTGTRISLIRLVETVGRGGGGALARWQRLR
ncbi:hypothetical protein WME73_36185 [Sorangium sp. So ce302]|uniref:hypothetical protein n=1 Tax=Sorangium sp. So ce302 TaxID=3133297 RepID=UPI003F5DF0E3